MMPYQRAVEAEVVAVVVDVLAPVPDVLALALVQAADGNH